MLKNKKGVGVMVGYVLLITAAVVMGVIVYQWLKTYVPLEPPECPDEVSFFIKKYTCDSPFFNLTLKNNGKFNIGGYFIHLANQSDQEIATIDISEYIESGGMWAGNAVVFVAGADNPIKPGDEVISVFKLDTLAPNQVYLVEIIPARFQEIENKLTFISCGDAKVQERIDDESCIF